VLASQELLALLLKPLLGLNPSALPLLLPQFSGLKLLLGCLSQ
jgi:hypothetical protein